MAGRTSLSESFELASGTVLPNRLVKAAMTEALADAKGRPTPKLCRLYETWSQGGTGTLITGNVQVDRRYVERPGNVCLDEKDRDSWEGETKRLFEDWAKSGTSYHNSKIIVQLAHAGRQSSGLVNINPVGPGNIRLNYYERANFGKPRALEADEIPGVVRRFVYAAERCAEAGFDGIQIHAAHGYLLSSFLNPLANNRPELFGAQDEYGGSLENRARVLRKIVQDVKAATPANFCVAVKLNSADFQEGGLTTEEAAKVAAWLEEDGIDFLELSGGNYETGIYGEATKKQESRAKNQRKSTIAREAYFLEYANTIQRSVLKLPLMVTGGWRTRSAMEHALTQGECALIGVGRPLCGRPDCAGPLVRGELDELPRYEDTVQVGYTTLQWLWYLPFPLLALIKYYSVQCWYYRNIVKISETGKGDESLGAFASMVANRQHEEKLAAELVGVECTGTVYQGASHEEKSS